jgi:hypothetical protein
MKKISELKPTIPFEVRTRSTIKANNIEEKIKMDRTNKYKEIDFSAEAFNSYDIMRHADRIGITLYYPDKTNPTHVLCKEFNFDIGMKELGLELKQMFKQLASKIPKMKEDNND